MAPCRTPSWRPGEGALPASLLIRDAVKPHISDIVAQGQVEYVSQEMHKGVNRDDLTNYGRLLLALVMVDIRGGLPPVGALTYFMSKPVGMFAAVWIDDRHSRGSNVARVGISEGRH